MTSPLLDYFDSVEIIHLKKRHDRYRLLKRELSNIGISITSPSVNVPDAPVIQMANGFPSPQVYGNFLSHLDILKRAIKNNVNAVLVLEDDAIFRTFIRSKREQTALVNSLEAQTWDIAFLGHPLKAEIRDCSHGFIQSAREFKWAHCYAVSARGLPGLVEYLERSIERPAGHEGGGKMYIDGAISLYRKQSQNVISLIHNPSISIQRGSPSGIAHRSWYDKTLFFSALIAIIRRMRDQFWRYTGAFGAK